ncbi:twin-arginine translocase TatA/TatE family subunit [Ponticaulis sp.]|uniref:twin-arginine translocase TatA/TatE family subunit n=1 Tax=Ponticaulis sp. TaxID=2020902 RepID=UPI0025F15EA7|nr:twin-arginine translocase TatA/TatE family subunit [Ponticaulis sp.]MDF1681404.1 twin-arginine translocase TatA/TatE family subunit [Ponticaulis sp.]
MAPSWMQLLIVAAVALLLFGGRGKISAIMGDMAKGIKSFRSGLKDDDDEDASPDAINVTPEKDKA